MGSRTGITDVSLRYIAQSLPSLSCLKLVGCSKITDAGMTQIGDNSLQLSGSLENLDISDCTSVKEISSLISCNNLRRISTFNSGLSEQSLNALWLKNQNLSYSKILFSV